MNVTYPVPPNDNARLSAIDEMGVMEAMDSPALDQIVRLAATFLEVPIALVSLVGRDIQRFRANHGLEGVISTPREASFCTHAIMEREVMVVPNATQDPRFTNNPLVLGAPGIRAYAGAPLVSTSGFALGALCTIDRKPRQFSPHQIELLTSLAEIATALLESEGNRRRLQALTGQLATRERELRSIADNVPIGIAHIDLQGRVLFSNRRLVADAPDPTAAAAASTLPELLGEELPESLVKAVEQARQGVPTSFELVRPRGRQFRHFEVSLIPDRDETGKVVGHFGMRYDITEQVQQRVALQEREQFLRSVFGAMAEGLLVQDAQGRIVEANHAAERLLDLSRDQLLGRSSLDSTWRVTREDGTVVLGADHPAMQTLRTGEPLRQQILCVRVGNDVARWVSVNTVPVFEDSTRRPTRVVVTFADITSVKQLQLELERARADLRAILDHVPVQISSWNPDATCRFANRRAAESFSLSTADMVGRTAEVLAGTKRWERARPFFESTLKGRGQSTEFIDEVAGGRKIYRSASWIPQQEGSEVVGVYAVVSDVTAIREFSERVRELARRLESVREQERRSIALTLHEGVAQDLFAMRLELEAMRESSNGHAAQGEAGAALVRALDHCIEDVRSIATTLQPTGLAPLRLGDAISHLASGFSAANGIEVVVRDEIGDLRLDAGTRALLFRTCEEGLRNAVQHGAPRRIQVQLSANQASTMLCVQDDGSGQTPDALEKPGALGLLALRERALSAGGSLHLTSTLPRGTSLILRVPIAPAPR